MKRSVSLLGCLLATALFIGSCVCYGSILEKYHALSSLDLWVVQASQIIYSITTVF